MHTQETQDRFILLRSQGMSFNDISTNLEVSRTTLLAWSRKFRYEIANQRAMNLEQLQQKHLKPTPTRSTLSVINSAPRKRN